MIHRRYESNPFLHGFKMTRLAPSLLLSRIYSLFDHVWPVCQFCSDLSVFCCFTSCFILIVLWLVQCVPVKYFPLLCCVHLCLVRHWSLCTEAVFPCSPLPDSLVSFLVPSLRECDLVRPFFDQSFALVCVFFSESAHFLWLIGLGNKTTRLDYETHSKCFIT